MPNPTPGAARTTRLKGYERYWLDRAMRCASAWDDLISLHARHRSMKMRASLRIALQSLHNDLDNSLRNVQRDGNLLFCWHGTALAIEVPA